MKCRMMRHFILVFTVYQRMYIGVAGMEQIKEWFYAFQISTLFSCSGTCVIYTSKCEITWLLQNVQRKVIYGYLMSYNCCKFPIHVHVWRWYCARTSWVCDLRSRGRLYEYHGGTALYPWARHLIFYFKLTNVLTWLNNCWLTLLGIRHWRESYFIFN